MAVLALTDEPLKTVLESGKSRVNVPGKDRIQVLINVYGIALCRPKNTGSSSNPVKNTVAVSSFWQRGKP